jgi:hypothetical protein
LSVNFSELETESGKKKAAEVKSGVLGKLFGNLPSRTLVLA